MEKLLIVLAVIAPTLGNTQYGYFVGDLKTNAHDVSGKVYAVDSNRIRIRNFNYDGTGPDAFFYVGKAEHGLVPSKAGTKINDERGTPNILPSYSDADIVLTLPDGDLVKDLKWLSVWCRNFEVNFGSLTFTNVQIPAAQNIGQFSELAHGVSSGDVTIMDAKTIKIANLKYDGAGPDAFFLVGNGARPDTTATKIPDEKGSSGILKGYTGQTITLTLPGSLTFYDIDYLSMYCIRFTQNFGDVRMPGDLNVPPVLEETPAMGLTNCEKLHDYLNVAWMIEGEDIIIELSGALEGDDGYMAFGISGSDTRSAMIQADAIVAYYTDTPQAEDYHINAYALCANGQGACPDTSVSGLDSISVESGGKTDGITTVRIKRKLTTGDSKDKDIPAGDTYIVWAMGSLNTQKMVTKHNLRLNGDKIINFTRSGAINCQPVTKRQEEKLAPWDPATISGEKVNTFSVQIGPAGGSRGYTALTGQQSWGIAIYLNELLIPELTLQRGQNYTFIVETGTDKSNNAEYHPFYITSDPIGGYSQKTDAEKIGIINYAGPSEGRYCEWKHKTTDQSKTSTSFADFFATLRIDCTAGTPGTLTWMPDENTPDNVFYQCWTHNFLGWKIRVVDDFTVGASPGLTSTGGFAKIVLSLAVCLLVGYIN